MRLGLSFLASSLEQVPVIGKVNCIEAVIFNREDLNSGPWNQSWINIEKLCHKWKAENLTFHFPVNDSDYVDSKFVRKRLQEAYQRASDLGIAGIVVHANRIRLIQQWWSLNFCDEQKRVVDVLESIHSSISTDTWIGLENMPLMDNFGKEVDLSFVYPEDFLVLKGSGVGVVWDICHWFNTVATLERISHGVLKKKYFPRIQPSTYMSFSLLREKIVHWHFSSFKGIADPFSKTYCKEGVLPDEGTLSSQLYVNAMKEMSVVDSDLKCIFEVAELDYTKRVRGSKIISWAKEILQMKSEEVSCAY